MPTSRSRRGRPDEIKLYRHEQTTLDYAADLCSHVARIAPPGSAVAKHAAEVAAALALLTAALVTSEVVA